MWVSAVLTTAMSSIKIAVANQTTASVPRSPNVVRTALSLLGGILYERLSDATCMASGSLPASASSSSD